MNKCVICPLWGLLLLLCFNTKLLQAQDSLKKDPIKIDPIKIDPIKIDPIKYRGSHLHIGYDFFKSNADSVFLFPKRPTSLVWLDFNLKLSNSKWTLNPVISGMATSDDLPGGNGSLFTDYRNNISIHVAYDSLLSFDVLRFTPKLNSLIANNVPLTGLNFQATPGAFKTTAAFGYVTSKIEADPSRNLPDVLRRWQLLTALRYEQPTWELGGGLLLVRDDKNSLTTTSVLPEANLVTSLDGSWKPNKKWLLKAELAPSIFTPNTGADSLAAHKTYLPGIGGIVNYNGSTRTGYAAKVNLKRKWKGKRDFIALESQYYSPEYRTLGVFFHQNDFVDVLAKGRLSFLKGDLSLKGATGFRYRQLSQKKSAGIKNKQFLANANVYYAASEHIKLNAYYSNYLLTIEDNTNRFYFNDAELTTDTIDGYQVKWTTHSLGISPSFYFGNDQTHRLWLNYNLHTYKNAELFTSNLSDENTTNNINGGYTYKQAKYMLGADLGYMKSQGLRDFSSFHIKPWVQFFGEDKRMQVNASVRYAQNLVAGSLDHQLYSKVDMRIFFLPNIKGNINLAHNYYRYGNLQKNLHELRLRINLIMDF